MWGRWNCRNPRLTTRALKGFKAEQIALSHLKAAGLHLHKKNFRCRVGEVDLIMWDDDCLVIVEVRCRTTARVVPPALTVDGRKQARIARTTSYFLARNPRLADCPVRFDVVGIESAESGPGTIQWIKDAFRV